MGVAFCVFFLVAEINITLDYKQNLEFKDYISFHFFAFSSTSNSKIFIQSYSLTKLIPGDK